MTTKDIKYWLEEKELKTPEHDEMVLWCFNHAQKILGGLQILPKEINVNTHSNIQNEAQTHFNQWYFWDWEKEEMVLDEKKYGNQIEEAHKNIEQYEKNDWKTKEDHENELQEKVDNLANVRKLKINVEEDYKKFRKLVFERKEIFKFKRMIEFSLYQGKWNIGFIDLKVECLPNIIKSNYFFESCDFHKVAYLEIKPKIESLGATMRQINFYKDYIPKNDDWYFILSTKTNNLNEIFKDQGVYVYNYREGQQKI